MFPPRTQIAMTYQDRIKQCKQQTCSQWEHDFLTSIFAYCNSPKFAGLSPRQEAKLQDIEKEFGLSRFLLPDGSKPYKDDSVPSPAIVPSPVISARHEGYKGKGFQDMDDDIPF